MRLLFKVRPLDASFALHSDEAGEGPDRMEESEGLATLPLVMRLIKLEEEVEEEEEE